MAKAIFTQITQGDYDFNLAIWPKISEEGYTQYVGPLLMIHSQGFNQMPANT
jgi:hypothetical protein